MPNYFAFFQLPEKFALDKKALQTAYRNLGAALSPHLSEKAIVAYQTLCHPTKRAAHLCLINGFSLNAVTPLSIPTDFIFEQIEWRNQIDNARIEKKPEQLERLSLQLQKRMKEQIRLIEEILDDRNFQSAIHEVKKMMFFEKFAEEIHFIFDEIDSANTL